MTKLNRFASLGLSLGLAVGLASADEKRHPMEGGDISADAKWGACLNIKGTKTSEVFEFLSQTIAHERLDELADRALYDWSVDLDSLETISISGADKDWSSVSLVVRGDFSDVDMASIPATGDLPEHGDYTLHRYALLDHVTLWLSKHSDRVMVAGDTIESVKRSLDVLDGKAESHLGTTEHPEEIRRQLASAVCVMGLDVGKLKDELELGSKLFAGTSKAWFVLSEENGTARAQLLMDHGTEESASGTLRKLEDLSKLAFQTDTTPDVVSELLGAMQIRNEGPWIHATAEGSSYDLVQMLGGLQELLKSR